MNITATELNKNPGKAIDAALQAPVVIEKSGRPTAVMVSYELFQIMEDAVWGAAAMEHIRSPDWASANEIEAFLRK